MFDDCGPVTSKNKNTNSNFNCFSKINVVFNPGGPSFDR